MERERKVSEVGQVSSETWLQCLFLSPLEGGLSWKEFFLSLGEGMLAGWAFQASKTASVNIIV